MNRRRFFAFLGIGAAAAVVAPKAFACMHGKTQELTVTRQDSLIIKHYLRCKDCGATVEQWETEGYTYRYKYVNSAEDKSTDTIFYYIADNPNGLLHTVYWKNPNDTQTG